MLGAIAGDVIGSMHEFVATKTTDFELFMPDSRFTDDTVLAVAVADCLLHGRDYVDAFHAYGAVYPDAGYGSQFYDWLLTGDAGRTTASATARRCVCLRSGMRSSRWSRCWRRRAAARR